MTEPLLSVRNLSVEYRTQSGTAYAVDNVSLDIEAGQQLGVIGESGCGKTTLMRALIRVLPRNGRAVAPLPAVARRCARLAWRISRPRWRSSQGISRSALCMANTPIAHR